ncbi:hypothetical protein POM88_053653 [Heracleum sosnowskyi]|uniref:CSC1/OSCA1-like 7TM region domain-containing protein n=1 Tax=Heracleum sosnowskyi TaxID=360622 RepID=A0AAD8GPL1_9APIA|nr:hypothetical protein POM88_053653 [Heracleum sosnowskyi]
MHLELPYVPTYLRQTESVEPMVQIVYYAFAGAEFFFSGGAELISQYIVHSIVFLTIAFYMIPIGLVSAFTTLENLKKLLPFIKPWVKKKALRTVLEAYLPQLALIVFLSLLPKLLLVLSKAEGIPSESLDARAASGKYFLFLRVQCVYGCYTGWNSFQYIQNHPEKCR